MSEGIDGYLSEADFRHAIASVPLVSVDLLVVRDGHLLLGRRRDEPARGTWFVPGGRIRRGEPIAEALQRIWRAEMLGESADESPRLIGAYEHFYERCFDGSATATHYVVLAYRVTPASDVMLKPDSHDAQWWAPIDESAAEHGSCPVHPNASAYFSALRGGDPA